MKKLIPYLIIIFLGLIPLLDLFHPGLAITHDGQDHVARIANFYQNLKEGNIIPRWAGNLNWGYGHPILMFLYPLPSYAGSLFHLLGFSLVDSVKIVFGLGFLLSGIAMCMWLKTFLSKEASIVGGILYMLAPYRFVDLYVRGAIGEHTAFIFLPLSLYFITKLKEGRSAIIGLSISLALLVMSHNALSLMFFPIILLYAFFLYSKSKEYLYRFAASFLLGLGLSAFFWIPSFFEGKYTLRDIVTAKDYAGRFVNFKDLFYGTWNYGISGQFSVQIGVMHWTMVFLSILAAIIMFKKKNRLWVLATGLLIILVISLFLTLPESKIIWDRITTLQKFQFPWRLLSVSVFSSAVLGGIVIDSFKNKRLNASVIVVLVLILYSSFWHAKGYLLKNEDFFTGIYNSTTDTGESSPIWSVRFMEKRPIDKIEVVDGDAKINKLRRTSTSHEYIIDASKETRIRENTLYFPGWEVLIDGKKTNIEFQDQKNRGLITFFVGKGSHKVQVLFGETKLRLISDIISLMGIIFLVILWKSKLLASF